MPASLIDNHLSFQPATEILAARDKDMPTPPGAGHALAAIAEAKAQLRSIKPRNLAPFMAQAWGLSPRGARRSVLIAAGMDADRWESPIHSFTEEERIELRAATSAAIRVYERLLNAI
ncbi:hypothetical protein [Janthinobacterium sp. GMG1]|uniref:hypothetical protein n=1 Tax=Janthinobacterium sp. GMG1 TaxID=3096007 RepID=UPI002ACA130E|nr:hypothetical protein [Janthinobacterium sp. GMG1]MDZ5636917.1 hypothetical protein [Janthinobacterium sp. GMG1]